jgi:hypothetical protein
MVSARMKGVLEARRSALNATYRRLGRGVDAEGSRQFLERTVDPIVSALPEALSARVVEVLFELGLVAARRGLLGGAEALPFEALLVEVLPRFQLELERDARRLVSAVANGYHRMLRERGAQVAAEWLRALAQLPVAEDRYCMGLVLAWRFGLAEARSAALDYLAELAPEVREALLGAREVDPCDERRFVAPGSSAALGAIVVRRVCGFRGFGGDFVVPPSVRAIDGRLYASDGVEVRELHADVFGARACRAAITPSEVAAAGSDDSTLVVDASGSVGWQGVVQHLPELEGATSHAAIRGLGAVTLECSFFVFLLGRSALAE